jgi:probable HAF family extracellular repeat protein
MKSTLLPCITAITLFAALAMPVRLAAQHSRYKLIQIGTLGGPTSYHSVNFPGYQIISNSGIIGLTADLSLPDPYSPNLCYWPDCFVSHATRWRNGVLTDLGALPGAENSSGSGAINARGWVAGQSQNGEIDPASGIPEVRAVLWTDAQIIDLGTFGGNWSLATTLNNAGQVVGFATNAIPDPFSLFIGGTQTRAFLWQNGVLRDLGTLGGPDAAAHYVNQHGQVAGVSYTNSTPNPTTGIPTLDPFLWQNGKMIDLGTLGGTFAGDYGPDGSDGSLIVNDRGQVIGISTLAGDQTYHPFLWDRGTLKDLGTLGGNNGTAVWLTDTGEVIGQADLPGSTIHHAFLWRNGVMTDLGTLGTNSIAFMMNSKGQIVGRSRVNQGSVHAFLWEDGGPMVDLNTLVPPNSVVLFEADNINERGEIVAVGLPDGCDNPDVCGQIVLLVPCNADDASGCESADVSTSAATQSKFAIPANLPRSSTQNSLTRKQMLPAWRVRLARKYHTPGVAIPKD